MKRKIITVASLVLAFSLLCGVSAFAATVEQINKNMTFTYTKASEGSEDTYSTPTPAQDPADNKPLYEISIPSEMSLNEYDTIPLYLTENNLLDGQRLEVYIDASTTIGADGYMHLHGAKGTQEAKIKIIGYDAESNTFQITGGGIWLVGAYEKGSNFPTTNGTLQFSLVNGDELDNDTYTGTVHFALYVVNEE